ncbi:MAG: 50S ribosomal protein L15 [Candidatus Harrisonbacteria bacterium CG10_big_fil_rev_8_21_14_0_10_40_38]|uniref:Large ribosomal subunit protein uL15 n=1 Tax=Candidatus Harrisonbacteria bacterium CG10_big_fil_rev_8_21_14_0_10_40_38 TaxID=1974583 RepID=A0A2H0USF8_9BACT|nr:MAG: 50S ribosomal protein L15 [Candidatus Harrisonbacteria bacterium CG10_big_fil_rev_8_21_14_0_10_40_38]
MQLHELKLNKPLKKTKPRVGRGGKRGTTAGRGTKGQKSRAGHRMRPMYRDLIQRLPKLRGVKNPSVKAKRGLKPTEINVDKLSKVIKGNEVNPKTLVEARVIKKTSQPVKILGTGEVSRAFEVEGVSVSKTAREKIEAKGGKIK